MFFGIDCYGICGDADGDGDAGRTSSVLAGNGGVDRPDLAGGEGIGIFMSFDYSVADVLPTFDSENISVPWNVVLGVPGGQPRSGPPLPCTANNATLNSTNCFGLYHVRQHERGADAAPLPGAVCRQCGRVGRVQRQSDARRRQSRHRVRDRQRVVVAERVRRGGAASSRRGRC
jgi:hypothetical protein